MVLESLLKFTRSNHFQPPIQTISDNAEWVFRSGWPFVGLLLLGSYELFDRIRICFVSDHNDRLLHSFFADQVSSLESQNPKISIDRSSMVLLKSLNIKKL